MNTSFVWFYILISSLDFYYILGQIYSIYIIAGNVSAIILPILVAFFRSRGSVSIQLK